MKKPMKTTDKIALTAATISALMTGALYWWIPDMHWGVYLGAWVLLTGAGFSELTRQKANERLADRDVIDKP